MIPFAILNLMRRRTNFRYVYSHGIAARTSDLLPKNDGIGLTLQPRGTRTSLTFRKTLDGPCQCAFPTYCDDPRRERTTEVNDENLARELEAAHVHQVYEKIAGHFSETRHSPWPRVVEFLGSVGSASETPFIVDVGCGNGKYLGQHPDHFQVGKENI